MKPAPFRYHAPESLAAALALKAEHGEAARFLAGGQSLVPTMNFRLAQPDMLIDLAHVPGLDTIEVTETTLRIGAFTRYHRLERDPEVAQQLPVLTELIGNIAHAQIRTQGTIGGNLAHADPASEMPAAMLALDARFHIESAAGGRIVPAPDFFQGHLTTALADDEMLVAIELPRLPPRTGGAFLEVARRKGDFALMGVIALVTCDEKGGCTAARLAYCNAADRPVLAAAAGEALIGTALQDAEIAAILPLVQQAIDPAGSLHASVSYQRHLAAVLTRRTLRLAADRAGGRLRVAA